MSTDQQQAATILSRIDRFAQSGQLEQAFLLARSNNALFEHLLSDSNALPFRIPNLLLIGPARTGTTWLKSTLSRHPDIYMFSGEPNVLWGISNGALIKSLQFYAKRKSSRTTLSSPIIAEKSPGYITLPDEDITMLSIINPSIKIIIGNRNERCRIWSLIKHKMNLQHFHGSWRDFIEIHSHEIKQEIKAGQINIQLERWNKLCPSSKIHIVNFSDISHNPEQILSDLISFIKIRPLSELSDSERTMIKFRLRMNPNPTENNIAPDDFPDFTIESVTD